MRVLSLSCALVVGLLLASSSFGAEEFRPHRRSAGNMDPNPSRYTLGNIPPQQQPQYNSQGQTQRTQTVLIPNPYYPGWRYVPYPTYPVYRPYGYGYGYGYAPGYYYAPGYNPYYYKRGFVPAPLPRFGPAF